MNIQNCIINSTNDYYLQVKNPYDNKLNLNYCYKNKSDNNLPLIEYNLFNKSLFNGINQKSEISNSSISRRSLKIKNKIDKVGINPIQELNSENIDEIISKKSKIFEALEKLLINDNNKNNDNNDNNNNDDTKINNNNHNKNNDNNDDIINKCHENIKKDSNNFLSLNKSQENFNNEEKKKEKKNLSSICVPKLDLSDIVSEYETSPLYIQEVKYVSINCPNKNKNKKKKKDKIDRNIETNS